MFYWTTPLKKGDDRFLSPSVAVGHRVYCFHNVVHASVFNTVTLCWAELFRKCISGVSAAPRKDHTAALVGETVYLWGGCAVEGTRRFFYSTLQAFDVSSHRWYTPKINGTVPKGRVGHSACVLGKVMYVYGGWNGSDTANDIYKLDTATMAWSSINAKGTPPEAPADQFAIITGTKMFVFRDRCKRSRSICVFDTETNCWLKKKQCGWRGLSRSAFAHDGEIYVFGFGDFGIWKFNPETFSWRKVETTGKGPGPTFMSKRCCTAGGRVILCGGYKYRTLTNAFVLDLSPSLKTLCKLAVIQYGLKKAGLPHNVSWELAAITNSSSNRKRKRRNK